MGRIAVVVPTIRPESYKTFLNNWSSLFELHDVELVTVWDGKDPVVEHKGHKTSLKTIMGKYKDAIVNLNGGVRNLGFGYVAKYLPEAEYIITLDDDERPIGDPIADHVRALNMRVPISWMSTASEYMRGFPYGVREEAEVMLSHGVWEGVADWDAPTQLVLGSHRPVTFPKAPIPKGILFPCCAMNLAFKPALLPWIYQAPKTDRIGRVDDILAGITAKREIDKNGWAAVTGYARVFHERESNVYNNLELEGPGFQMYEDYWQGIETHPYLKTYKEKLKSWQTFLNSLKT